MLVAKLLASIFLFKGIIAPLILVSKLAWILDSGLFNMWRNVLKLENCFSLYFYITDYFNFRVCGVRTANFCHTPVFYHVFWFRCLIRSLLKLRNFKQFSNFVCAMWRKSSILSQNMNIWSERRKWLMLGSLQSV